MTDLSNSQKFYINGEWVDPIGRDTIEVINPASEQPINTLAMGNAADVDRAVDAAAAAFESFSQTTKEQRVVLFERIIGAYQKLMPQIAEHADEAHDIKSISPELMGQVRQAITA